MAKTKSAETIKSRTLAQETWRRLLKNKGAVIGMTFLILLVVVLLMLFLLLRYAMVNRARRRRRRRR